LQVGGAARTPVGQQRPRRRREAGEPDVRHRGRDTGAVAKWHHREPEQAVGHQQDVRAEAQLVRPERPAQGFGGRGRRRGQQQPGGG